MSEIFTRTSIRQFTNQPVEAEKIEQILRAAMAAPSATNQQPWEFYVITNKEIIEKLSTVSPYAGPLKTASVAIVPCTRKDCKLPDFGDIDMAIASENIWLACEDLGLGTVMLGIAPLKERIEAVNEIVGVAEHLDAFTIFPVGYPEKKGPQQDRFDSTRIHYID